MAFASVDLINEVECAVAKGGLVVGAVYHGTRSGALPGVARRKSILSFRRIIELGEDVTTGEISAPEGRVHRSQNGLEDVYACSSPVNTHYAFQKTENILSFSVFTTCRPLGNVVSITVPYEQLSGMEMWTQEHCRPDTLVYHKKRLSC